MTIFSVDTSALVGAWSELYTPRRFPGLWRGLEDMIRDGDLIASEEVLHELQRKDDDLLRWARAQDGLFVPMDERIEVEVKRVVRIPNLVKGASTDNSADPFVIATAIARGATVVSQESNGGPSHPRIPYVCRALGVPHMNLGEFVNSRDWSFE